MKNFKKKLSGIMALSILFLGYACTKDFEEHKVESNIAVAPVDASTLKYIGNFDIPCYDVINKTYKSKNGLPISESEAKSNRSLNINPSNRTAVSLEAGMGYNPLNGGTLESPFGPPTQIDVKSSFVKYYSVSNSSQKNVVNQKAGAVSVGFGGKFLGGKVSVEASYSKNVSEAMTFSDNSFSLVCVVGAKKGKEVMTGQYGQLSDSAKKYANNLTVKDQNGAEESFVSKYGLSYISEIEYGCTLTIILNVQYNSEEYTDDEKQTFKLKVGAKYFGANADFDGEYITSDSSNVSLENTTVKCIVYTTTSFVGMGTNPDEILQLIKNFNDYIQNPAIKDITSITFKEYNSNPSQDAATFLNSAVANDYKMKFERFKLQCDRNADKREYLEILTSLQLIKDDKDVYIPTISNEYVKAQINQVKSELEENDRILYAEVSGLSRKQKTYIDLINALRYIKIFKKYNVSGNNQFNPSGFPRTNVIGKKYDNIRLEHFFTGSKFFVAYDNTILKKSSDFINLEFKGLWRYHFTQLQHREFPNFRRLFKDFYYDVDRTSNPATTKLVGISWNGNDHPSDQKLYIQPHLVCVLPESDYLHGMTPLYVNRIHEYDLVSDYSDYSVNSPTGNKICDVIKLKD